MACFMFRSFPFSQGMRKGFQNSPSSLGFIVQKVSFNVIFIFDSSEEDEEYLSPSLK